MVELLEETRANTEYIRSKGYRVVEMWECEWPQMKRTETYSVLSPRKSTEPKIQSRL